jgi:hypothetical protein
MQVKLIHIENRLLVVGSACEEVSSTQHVHHATDLLLCYKTLFCQQDSQCSVA